MPAQHPATVSQAEGFGISTRATVTSAPALNSTLMTSRIRFRVLRESVTISRRTMTTMSQALDESSGVWRRRVLGRSLRPAMVPQLVCTSP
ncbi:hypothetical protein [Streptomyces syringium]|uniref:hypothetical protein n=1 Tax=Streptomyces syringium TaxID=76729 RepID=UPI0034522264